MRFVKSLLLLSVVAVLGCDSGPVADTTVQEDPLNQTIKGLLEQIVESGEIEDLSEVRSYIEEDMLEVDEAKSALLMKDLEELQGMSSPAAIKAKATEMIGKL